MNKEGQIKNIAKRIRLVMKQKTSVAFFYHDLEKLIDLIIENEDDNANSTN